MSPTPPISEPVIDGDGRMTVAWYTWFDELRTRMGGDTDLTLTATNIAFTARVVGTDDTVRDGGLVLS
jgi:hypothetical protein